MFIKYLRLTLCSGLCCTPMIQDVDCICRSLPAYRNGMFVMNRVPIPSCMHGSKQSQHCMGELVSL